MKNGININRIKSLYNMLNECCSSVLIICERLRELETKNERDSREYIDQISVYYKLCEKEREITSKITKRLTAEELEYFYSSFLMSEEEFSTSIVSDYTLKTRMTELIYGGDSNFSFARKAVINNYLKLALFQLDGIDIDVTSIDSERVRIERKLEEEFVKKQYELLREQLSNPESNEQIDILIRCMYLTVALNPTVDFNLYPYIDVNLQDSKKYALLDQKPEDEDRELYDITRKEWLIEVKDNTFRRLCELLDEDLSKIGNYNELEYLLQQLRTVISFFDESVLNIISDKVEETFNKGRNSELIKNRIIELIEQGKRK